MTPSLALLIGAAWAQTGPTGPADPYTPVQSGELFGTAHVLPDGRKQIRLTPLNGGFLLSHWGLTERVQLDVQIADSIAGPNVGVEYNFWADGNSAASITVSTDSTWSFKQRTATALAQYTLGSGEYNRLNFGLGFGAGRLSVPNAAQNGTEITAWRTLPASASFDHVVSDRRIRRYALAVNGGPALTGGNPEAELGYLWTYGFEKFRISAGGGLRYAPTFGDRLNAALITAKQDPIPFPDVLPKLDLNLWWAW